MSQELSAQKFNKRRKYANQQGRYIDNIEITLRPNRLVKCCNVVVKFVGLDIPAVFILETVENIPS